LRNMTHAHIVAHSRGTGRGKCLGSLTTVAPSNRATNTRMPTPHPQTHPLEEESGTHCASVAIEQREVARGTRESGSRERLSSESGAREGG
jgi:hypothetical protein